MLTRREFMVVGAVTTGAVAAGMVFPARRGFAKASQPSTPVNFDVPAGACDCHVHIHYPEKFPFFEGRGYTPEAALPEELLMLHKALHIQRAIIITPSVYGTDNSAMLFGMKAYGAGARGIVAVDDKTSESDLDAMNQAGVRGISVNLATGGGTLDPAVIRPRFLAGVERAKSRNWCVHVYATLDMILVIRDLVAASPVPVVFDHFGAARAELGLQQKGFPELVELVRSGKAYMKTSYAYRQSKLAPDYPDLVPLAQALINANPDRIVWGTAWPHPNSTTPPGKLKTDITPLFQVDAGQLLNLLPVWAPDPAIRKKILVDNPARLYGF